MNHVSNRSRVGEVGRSVVVGLALVLTATGCGIGESIVAAVEEAADNLISEALKGVQDSAKAAGGDAVEVGPEGAELAFDDASHELHRTRVSIPAGALPEGTERAVLSVVPNPTYAVPGTEWAAAGPVAEIRLQALPGLSDIELVTSATVQVPVTVETEDELSLAHGGDDGLSILAAAEADDGAVAGLTTSFSPFVAVTPAPPVDEVETPANTLSYSVAQTGSVLCNGTAFSPTVGVHEAWLVFTSAGLSTMDLQFVVNSASVGEVGVFGMTTTPRSHGAADFPIQLARTDFTGMDQWVYCDASGSNPSAFNFDGSGSPALALTLMSFEVTGTTAATDCGDGAQACTRSFGTLWYRLTMSHDDSNDPTFSATATFDGVINGARWETAP
jgi:hypothetical protein